MHPYATDSTERTRIPLIMAALSICLAWVFSRIPWSMPWWVDAPSVIGFYSLIHVAFDQSLWRSEVLRKVCQVRVPDLTGDWEGFVVSSHHGNGADQEISITIRQTWTRLCVVFRTDRSLSRSLVAAINVDEPEGPALIYEYRNEPCYGAPSTMHVHYGAARLTFDSGEGSLSGSYYTGRDRETYGGLRLVRRPRDATRG